MRKKDGISNPNGPKGKLVEALEIERDEEIENPSLHIKLQGEMAKPLNSSIRKAAADSERIGKLKAKNGLKSKDFLDYMH